jgi:CBS domain-containing protein
MTIGRLCTREVVLADPDESVLEAARRMRDADVGTLVVVDAERCPVGILTDRDVALRAVAEALDPAHTPVASVMSVPVTRVSEATPIEDALARMAGAAVRRLVVVDEGGRLAGLVALDDVLDLLVDEVGSIGRLLRSAGRGGSATRRAREGG